MRIVDAATGLVLLVLGVVCSRRAPGRLLLAAGVLWFVGDVAAWAVYLHRGPLVQLVLVYPHLRPRTAVAWITVVAGYFAAGLAGLARFEVSGPITLVVAAAVVASAVSRYVGASGVERTAQRAALGAAVALFVALSIGSGVRLAGAAGAATDDVVEVTYDVLVVLVAGWLAADLRWGRWTGAVVAGLVVDLGQSGPVRSRLCRALGDPTLTVGFWLAAHQQYVDELGQPVSVAGMSPTDGPGGPGGRVVTWLDVGGERVGVLIHDASVVADGALIAAVADVARLALANIGLREEIRARAAEVAASRANLIELAAAARRGLAEDLRRGPERRLARVAELLHVRTADDLGEASEALARLEAGLHRARAVMGDLLAGIDPPALSAGGLPAGLTDLVQVSPVPVFLDVPGARFPVAVETALYFVCSEALANLARYSGASHARIRVWQPEPVCLALEVEDDGVGGVRVGGGSGLRGLADRIAALGGHLVVDSPPGRGTRVRVDVPLPRTGGQQ